jgi:hypothetical protein
MSDNVEEKMRVRSDPMQRSPGILFSESKECDVNTSFEQIIDQVSTVTSEVVCH